MKALFTATVAMSALMLTACSEEPEVAETEEIGYEETEALGTEGVGVTETAAVATWDTNNDGIFQQAEYSTWDQSGIEDWDVDDDSRLSSEEFNTGWTNAGFSNPEGVYSTWDDDGDGFLSDDEFFDDEEWTEWDVNSSGVLETAEFGYY